MERNLCKGPVSPVNKGLQEEHQQPEIRAARAAWPPEGYLFLSQEPWDAVEEF